jgi:hypothetical protein
MSNFSKIEAGLICIDRRAYPRQRHNKPVRPTESSEINPSKVVLLRRTEHMLNHLDRFVLAALQLTRQRRCSEKVDSPSLASYQHLEGKVHFCFLMRFLATWMLHPPSHGLSLAMAAGSRLGL